MSEMQFSSVASEITIEGQAYRIAPLNMGDRAAAERRIRDRRMNHMLERIRQVPLSDGAIGAAIAGVECSSVTLDELLDTYESRIYLIYLSLKGGGNNITEKMVEEIPETTTKVLGELIRHISGVKSEGDDTDHPTICTPPNSTDAEATTGVSS